MATRITRLHAHDVRFPTSDLGDGSDAMHTDPDYSAAVAIIETDDPAGVPEWETRYVDAIRRLSARMDALTVLIDGTHP